MLEWKEEFPLVWTQAELWRERNESSLPHMKAFPQFRMPIQARVICE